MPSARYQELHRIGEGVSATVYRARDTATGSPVAIKVLNPHLATDPTSLERFKREVQIARAIGHPQIVAIYDLVVEGDETYLVMEHVPGDDLKTYAQRRGPLALDDALDVLQQVLRVLAVCHAKQVVHRDLKPQNAIRMPDGTVKLLDFGIARMTTLGDLTQTGASLGSPEYMAPELFAANTWDPRTDLYALGAILFELLAGVPPFRGDSVPALYHQHAHAPVPSLASLRRGLPAWVQHLVERLLAKSPHERYQSADEVLADVAARRVVAKEVPRLARRECVACGLDTMADLPWCTSCGHDLVAGFEPGGFDLWSTETTDRDALARWLATIAGERAALPRAGIALLVRGTSSSAAELLRQSARRHGVVLAVRRHSERSTVTSVLAVGGLLLFGGIGLGNTASLFRTSPFFSPLPYANAVYIRSSFEYLLTAIFAGIFLLLAWGMVRILRRQPGRTVLSPTTVRRHVGAEDAWLVELVAAERRAAGGALAGLLPRLVEKYLQLRRAAPTSEGAIDARLRRVLRTAAETVTVAADIARSLDPGVLARLAGAFGAVSDQLEVEHDPARRPPLLQRRTALAADLEQAWALQDAHARLLGRLIDLQCTFNRLLGNALVLHTTTADADALEACVRALETDLAAARAAQAQLGRAA